MLSLRHSLGARTQDRGFSLVELMVALLILTVVMLTTAGIFISAIRGIDEAKRRQTGAALGTEVMEQLRSLPYDAIRAGMLDDGTLADDYGVLNGEALVSTTGLTVPPPLHPHVQVKSVNNTQYTTTTYVTLVSGKPGYWLTAVVTWKTRSGKPQRVVYRSQAFSPTGCLSTGQHPFSGPCQASLYAAAGTSTGSIAVRPLAAGGTVVEGLDVQELELALPGVYSSSIVEQTTAVAGKVTGMSARLKRVGLEEVRGGATAVSGSDDDPSTAAGGGVSSNTLTAGSTGVLTRTIPAVGTLAATLVTTDSGQTRSGVRADTAPACTDGVGPVQGDQPCGSSSVTTSAGANALELALPGLNSGASFVLASVEGAGTTRTRAARHVGLGTPVHCAAPTGDGCAVAVVDRRHGAFKLGGLPSPVPSTTRTSLVEVTGLRELVTSVVGAGATPQAPRIEGTLSYWNGTSFQAVDLGVFLAGKTSPVNLPTSTYTATNGTVTLKVTLDLVLQPPTVEVTGPPPVVGVPDCSTEPCMRNVTSDAVVAGTLTYEITNGGTPLASFTIDVALGGTVAKTSYKASGG